MVAGKRQLIALWYYRRSVAQILLVSCQTVSPTSPSFVTPQSFHLLGFHALIQPLQPFAKPHAARIPHPYVSSLIISILLLLSIRVKSSLEIILHHILLSFYFAWCDPWHAKFWTPPQSQMGWWTLLIWIVRKFKIDSSAEELEIDGCDLVLLIIAEVPSGCDECLMKELILSQYFTQQMMWWIHLIGTSHRPMHDYINN